MALVCWTVVVHRIDGSQEVLGTFDWQGQIMFRKGMRRDKTVRYYVVSGTGNNGCPRSFMYDRAGQMCG